MFNKIIGENFPNLEKNMSIKIQDAYRTSNRLDQKKKSPCHIINNIVIIKNKRRISRAAKEKG